MRVGVIVTAAGSGARLGAAVPKALVAVGERTLLEHAIARALSVADELVVTAPESHLEQFGAVTHHVSSRFARSTPEDAGSAPSHRHPARPGLSERRETKSGAESPDPGATTRGLSEGAASSSLSEDTPPSSLSEAAPPSSLSEGVARVETRWSQRQYMRAVETIASGDSAKIAEVVRELSDREDSLSEAESQMLGKARTILNLSSSLSEGAPQRSLSEGTHPSSLSEGVARVETRAVTVVSGGASRQDSVNAGLAALGDVDLVLVHDAARAFAPAALFRDVVAALRGGYGAVIPALPVVDTIKRADADRRVTGTVDRSELWAVQTPQGFRRDLLRRAHAEGAGTEATDDAALVEALGEPVQLIPGHEDAFKVTTPRDLALAEALMANGAFDG